MTGNVEEMVRRHREMEVGVVVAQHYMESRVKTALRQAGVEVVDGVGARYVPLVCRAAQVTPLTTWTGLHPSLLGFTSRLSQVSFRHSRFILLSTPHCASVLLSNLLKDEVDIVQDAFQTGFKVLTIQVLGRTLLQKYVFFHPNRTINDFKWTKNWEVYREVMEKAVEREVVCANDLIEALNTAKELISVLLRTDLPLKLRETHGNFAGFS